MNHAETKNFEIDPKLVIDPLAGWDEGLPRTSNPHTGEDDTEARKAQCEEAYKMRHHTYPSQVRALRRGLYMSIVHLRTESFSGYVLDKQAARGNVRPPVLQ